VFQPTFVRENVTDYKLTLHCILGLLQATSGQIMNVAYAGTTQTEAVLGMIKSLGLTSDYISPNISTKVLPRDKFIFGNAQDYFNGIAKDNDMVWFLAQRGLGDSATGGISFGALSDGIGSDTKPGFIYTPTTGLLGTPVQTQYGVDFSVLLDPRIKAQLPLLSVGIDQAIIQQFQTQPGTVAWPLQLTGTYVVVDVRHRGDSRGDLWQTDITGCVIQGDVLRQLTAAA
jgi:hypothetical protein